MIFFSFVLHSEKDKTHPKWHGWMTMKPDTDTEDEQYFHGKKILFNMKY